MTDRSIANQSPTLIKIRSMKNIVYYLSIIFLLGLSACTKETGQGDSARKAAIFAAYVNGMPMTQSKAVEGVPVDDIVFELEFSTEIDVEKFDPSLIVFSGGQMQVSAGKDSKTLQLKPTSTLRYFTSYTLNVLALDQLGVSVVEPYRYTIVTQFDTSDKFERISDEELLTLIQEKTFKYFWDYAHPVSGLSRERLNSEETVTSGGSGFGIMTIPVGIERGFITRDEGAERMLAIATFLDEKAERFHGVYSHWLDGTTGKAIAFSAKDDGADLVETGFLIEGLLTVQQYFNLDNPTETAIRQKITKIWEAVEWDWFINSSNALYWHWSPKHNWAMNMNISGWNEALIVYVLAAASPTHPIDKSVYDQGWARNGGMKNGRKFYDFTLPLGSNYGGPLFFAHYSFLGLDPRNLKDQYADYWEQNVAHAKINHAYCVANPKKYYGYSDECWGLTASDIPKGYTASSPTNDGGTIAPTAAVASIPYTPEESLKAIRYFYYVLGDKLWGEYGFKDSFNLSARWFAPSYIAIDQGPIVLMIENYRTGLLWENFMKNEDVKMGLDKLGFTY